MSSIVIAKVSYKILGHRNVPVFALLVARCCVARDGIRANRQYGENLKGEGRGLMERQFKGRKKKILF